MRWEEIVSLMQLQQGAFFERQTSFSDDVQTVQDWLDTLLALEQETGRDLDDICREFASTLKWPEMDSKTVFILLQRLEFAGKTALTLTTAKGESEETFVPVPNSHLADILTWLLVDCWNAQGRDFWRDQLEWHVAQMAAQLGD